MSEEDYFNLEEDKLEEGVHDGEPKESSESDDGSVGNIEGQDGDSEETVGLSVEKGEEGQSQTSEEAEEEIEDGTGEGQGEGETSDDVELEEGEESNISPPQTLVKKKKMESRKDSRAQKYLGGGTNPRY